MNIYQISKPRSKVLFKNSFIWKSVQLNVSVSTELNSVMHLAHSFMKRSKYGQTVLSKYLLYLFYFNWLEKTEVFLKSEWTDNFTFKFTGTSSCHFCWVGGGSQAEAKSTPLSISPIAGSRNYNGLWKSILMYFPCCMCFPVRQRKKWKSRKVQIT